MYLIVIDKGIFMSQKLLHHRRRAMGSAAFAKAAQAIRQAGLCSALSRWDGEGGAEPDGPQEGGRPTSRVLDTLSNKKPTVSVNPHGDNT
jgi:hypothetical protein